MGFKVFTAENPLQALVSLGQSNPRLIITDCDMGELSGLHLTKKIRQMGSQVPIVMFSGNDAAKETFEELAGGTAFFLKSELTEMLAFVDLQAKHEFKLKRVI